MQNNRTFVTILLHSQMKSAETYTKNQLDKLGNALIFICQNLESASKTHLLKLIFIIEEISIKKFGIPFFDLKFEVWKLGPVSPELYVELTDEPNLLADYIQKDNARDNVRFIPKKDFSDDEFNDDEIKLLNQIVERFKYCTTKELINFTHRKDTPWYNTALKNGVLDQLENNEINTTDIEINLAELIENKKDKLNLYNHHKKFLQFSKDLKS